MDLHHSSNKDNYKIFDEFEFMPDPITTELAALERLKIMYNVVSTLAPSFLIGSSSFLQVAWTAIKS